MKQIIEMTYVWTNKGVCINEHWQNNKYGENQGQVFTLIKCLFTHFVKVFFCTRSRSSAKHTEKTVENHHVQQEKKPSTAYCLKMCSVRSKPLNV